MGFNHHYDLVKGSEDGKDEPQHTTVPVTTSWWKFLLCNLLAASAGAGVTFLIAHGSFGTQSSSSAAVSSSVSAPVSTPIIAPVSASVHATASTTTSIAAVLPTSSSEHIDAEIKTPNMLPGQILDCGGSPAEARAKGCIYDVMMQDWVPEPCYDSVLTERFLAQGNWTWYANGDGTEVLSDEQMRKGEHGVAWMSNSYHKDHCVFSWIKIVRALRNNRGISQELVSYDHVLHCAHGALKMASGDSTLGVFAPTNYAKCALYDTWLKDPIPDKHDAEQR